MSKVVHNYVDRYIKRYHSKMLRICEPLQKFLGINYFTYHSLSSEGGWCPIVSRLDWAEYYTESQLYLPDPFLVHPRFYRSGAVMWQSMLDPDQYQEILDYAGEKFDMAHGMILVEKAADRCEFFGFTAPKNHGQIYHTYLNDMPLLKKFCQYFKEEMAPIIKMAQQDPVDLLGLKGDAFEKDLSFGFADKPKNLFVKSIHAEPSIKLSRREQECLRLYLDDARMIDVAQKLGLSIRTVEAYLTSLKTKLDCLNKAELLKKGQELRSLGLI